MDMVDMMEDEDGYSWRKKRIFWIGIEILCLTVVVTGHGGDCDRNRPSRRVQHGEAQTVISAGVKLDD